MNNIKKNKRFEWFASGNAPLLFPTELVTGGFLFDDLTKVNIPESSPFATAWGKSVSMHLLPDNHHPVPKFIFIIWFSMVESKFYAVADELPQEKIEALLAEKDKNTKKPKYDTLIAGMAPYGNLAIWLSGNGMTTEAAWLQGKEIPMEMKDFAPKSKLTKEEYAKKALADCKEAYRNFNKNGLPDPMLFERYMQKFNYRITPTFENEETILEGIEMCYYNGELNTTADSAEYAENAMRAKPSKIVLKWSDGKKQYNGYFWTNEHKIVETFLKFYEMDAQEEGNFIIEVKASHRQFRFSLQNSNASVEIPVEDMQYIIFKNKFEFHRSANYSKPPQGWRN